MDKRNEEATRILRLMNEQSASLILMVLCDDNLDVHQVEVESDNEILESRVKAVTCITGSPSRVDIAKATRNFIGRFYTEGQNVSFLHPELYFSCMHALHSMIPHFVLQNCSLTFLYERVQGQPSQSSVKENHGIVFVSEDHYNIIASRLADAIEDGQYSMSLSNSLLQERTLLDKVFDLLDARKHSTDGHNTSSSAILCKTEDGKYVLQWALEASNLYLINKLELNGYIFSLREIYKGFHSCVCHGGSSVLEYLLQKHRPLMTPLHIVRAFREAIDNKRLEIVDLLLQNRADISDLSFERQKKLFQLAGEHTNIWMCQEVVNHALANHPILERVGMIFLEKSQTVFTDICNEVLQIACTHACMPLAEVVVAFCDINNRDRFGRTPIINAGRSCGKNLFQFLVTKGANLTQADNFHDTVFHGACFGGNMFVVEQTLSMFDINIPGHRGWTPLMNAAYAGQEEMFEYLMTKGADITLTDRSGYTVLHLASGRGRTSIVNSSLSSLDINIRGNSSRTPVMVAAQFGQKEVFELLVSKGADLTLTDEDGDNVFHYACAQGNMEIVKRVASMFDIDLKGSKSQTPLMKAVCNGQMEVLEFLLSHQADMTLVDDDGDSLLHIASEYGQVDMIKRILPFSDINLRNKPGWTPVMKALLCAEEGVFQYFMDEDADLTLVDRIGDDMLTLAYRGGCDEIVKQLTPAGKEIMETEPYTWTDQMLELVYGHFSAVEDYESGDPELIEKDGFGDTLLHLACRGGNKQCVEHLLSCYDINVRGRYNWTPVMVAARCGHLDVLQCLLSHQADLSLVSDTGEDVLTLAQHEGDKDIVTFLLTLQEFSDRL